MLDLPDLIFVSSLAWRLVGRKFLSQISREIAMGSKNPMATIPALDAILYIPASGIGGLYVVDVFLQKETGKVRFNS